MNNEGVDNEEDKNAEEVKEEPGNVTINPVEKPEGEEKQDEE